MNAFASATTSPIAFAHRRVGTASDHEIANLETARLYLTAIERSTSGAESGQPADEFFSDEVEQIEYPNRFVPNGATRDRAALKAAAERGKKALIGQRYEVIAAYALGDTVILEVLWVGTLAIPVGNLAVGDEMRAHFAVFLEFRDERIIRQRNYDCFEPF
jgi:ketosteroid isomerase-like protein